MSEKRFNLGELVRGNGLDSSSKMLSLIIRLSFPTMISQLTVVIMEYIDAAMVGSLGASASASIGLVASTTWFFGNLISAVSVGFSVQIAQEIGAGRIDEARKIHKQGIIISIISSLIITSIGIVIAPYLPIWLGGGSDIIRGSYLYFLLYVCFIPFFQLGRLELYVIEAGGNMVVPAVLNIFCCLLDVVLNFFLIYPTREIGLFGSMIQFPGAGMGVAGASLGTSLANVAIFVIALYYAGFHLDISKVTGNERWKPEKKVFKKAMKIAVPIGVEQGGMCLAYIATTAIVAPLGTISLAAHSFAITAEGLCYMPGYGIGNAATAIIGQSVGAGKKELTKKFTKMIVSLAVIVMALAGVAMYFLCPYVIEILTPDIEVRSLAVKALKIELFAEPLYGLSIAASGALRGVGDTLIPGIMDLVSMWGIRISLSVLFADLGFGLVGIWLAMAIELCVRGLLFLFRVLKGKWLDKAFETTKSQT